MQDDTIESNIYKSGAKLFDKLNLFTIFHAVWLIEMYYLGINVLFNEAMRLDQEISKKVPVIVLQYNEVILSYFTGYNEFVVMISAAIFICGITIFFVKYIPMVGKYKLIDMYSGYGITCSFWLAIIYGTYKLYINIKLKFLFTPILVFVILELVKKIGKYIEEKTGITFSGKDYY